MRRKSIFITLAVLSIMIYALCFAGCSGLLGSNKNESENENENNAELIDIQTDCEVRISTDGDIFYDGSPKTVGIRVLKNGEVIATVQSGQTETDDLTITYYDNVNVGNARVAIAARANSYKLKGSTELTFEIKPVTAQAKTFDELNLYAESGNYREITLEADITVEANRTLTVASGVTVKCDAYIFTNYGTLSNNGRLSIKDFRNYGTVNNVGGVELAEAYKLYNFGLLTGKVKVRNGYEIFTVSDITIEEQGSVTPNTHKLTDLSSCRAELYSSEFDWTGSAIEPAVIIKNSSGGVLDKRDLTVSYTNNTDIGKATVKIKAEFGSEYFYGETEVDFDIIAPMKTVQADGDFEAVWNEPNYKGVILTGNEVLTETITVPQNKRLTIDASYVSFPVAIINNGELIINKLKTVFFDEDISNEGLIENNGEIFVSGDLIGVGTIANNGEIYANSSLNGVTNSENAVCVYRTDLNGVNVTLSQDSFDYAEGGISVPTARIDAEALEGCSYSVRTSGGQDVEAPRLCGDYLIDFTADKNNKLYFGTKTLSYSIVPSVLVIDKSSDSQKFADAFNDDGYYKIQVSASIYNWVDAITKEVEITSDGLLRNSTALSIESTVVNNGSIICYKDVGTGGASTIIVGEGGSVINNGGIYVNAMSPSDFGALTAAVSGNVYNRIGLADESRFQITFNKNIALRGNASYAYIDMADLDLAVTKIQDNTRLSANEYTISVATNKNVCTKNNVRVTVTAKELSTEVYGSISFTEENGVNIVPGEVSVGSFNDLKAALTINANQLYNWSLVKVTSSFAIKSNVTVPQDVTVFINDTRTSIWRDGGKLTVKGQLIIDLKFDASNMVKSSDVDIYTSEQVNGRVVYNVTDMLGISVCLNDPSCVFTVLKLKKDIDCGAYKFENYSQAERIIDLNGYTLTNVRVKMQIHNSHITGALKFTSTAAERGTIAKSAGNDYALTGEIENAHKLYLENLVIQGMCFEKSAVNVNGAIDAKNCAFVSDGSIDSVAPALLNAAHTYTFTDCELEGYCGIRISAGHANLIGCTVKALGNGSSATDRIKYGNSISVVSMYDVSVYVAVTECSLQYTSGYGIYVSAEQSINSVSHARAQVTLESVTYSSAVNNEGYSSPYNSANSPFKTNSR